MKPALDRLWDKADGDWFRLRPSRKYHIRHCYNGENEAEFRTLGAHEERRRRVILTRVDALQEPLPDHKVLKIPFLVFADESIEDEDDIIFPIVRDIMTEALKGQPDILAAMKARAN